MKVKGEEFLGAFPSLEDLPEDELPEFAFSGRSNVGKSTLFNRLLGRRSLARTSSTPGCTQALNAYSCTLIEESGEAPLRFIDLPGFGYAKFSKVEREKVAIETVRFVQERENLRCLFLLNDSRRKPGEDEIALRNLAFDAGVLVCVVLTKIDKLKKNDIKKQQASIAKAYGLEPADMILSGEKKDCQAIWNQIVALL